MSDFHNRSQTSARRGDYVWQYEYYDDEEPVSFEGLKAHRYSIVIGFWVGLAVFVIFMFFVLTLLTKTGAPHQENSDSAEKRQHHGSCLVDFNVSQPGNEKAFSRPLLMATHSYFHFYINEEDQNEGTQQTPGAKGAGKTTKVRGDQQGSCSQNGGTSYCGMNGMERDAEAAEGHSALKEQMAESKTDRECASLSHFNIPNFVNMEHNSPGAEDLEDESSFVLERQSYSRDACCDIH